MAQRLLDSSTDLMKDALKRLRKLREADVPLIVSQRGAELIFLVVGISMIAILVVVRFFIHRLDPLHPGVILSSKKMTGSLDEVVEKEDSLLSLDAQLDFFAEGKRRRRGRQ
ncbi:unnamed protein product [Caenorhabditis auriculariae]|uniref:Uncharacterized protein n=1 Tax=Caenorhabditis auriculariae TaxID=2777116 RepID=A0A8S1HB05_9PELO|nr:unnamed protein product [Caenorhabditis auriculariae]